MVALASPVTHNTLALHLGVTQQTGVGTRTMPFLQGLSAIPGVVPSVVTPGRVQSATQEISAAVIGSEPVNATRVSNETPTSRTRMQLWNIPTMVSAVGRIFGAGVTPPTVPADRGSQITPLSQYRPLTANASQHIR